MRWPRIYLWRDIHEKLLSLSIWLAFAKMGWRARNPEIDQVLKLIG